MEERLRGLGFKNDATARFVGHYLYDGLVDDFMPMNENVLGFSNRWYEDGYNNATIVALDERTSVKIFTALMLDHPNFEEWVNAHVGFNSSAAADLIISGLKAF